MTRFFQSPRVQLYLLPVFLFLMLLLGEVDIRFVSTPEGLDPHQWWIYLWISICAAGIYYTGKHITRLFYGKISSPTKIHSFIVYHIGVWWGVMALVAIMMFYWFPETRSYENEYCLASFTAIVFIVFSWLGIISIMKRSKGSLGTILPLFILGYIADGVSFGIILYDLQEVHGYALVALPIKTFANYMFSPLVSVFPIKTLATSVFEWIILLAYQGTMWFYRLGLLAGITYYFGEWYKKLGKKSNKK